MPEGRPDAGAFASPRVAAHYEGWYTTPEGARADALEKEALSALLQSFPRADRVLEVGCGTGHFTRWLHGQGTTAVGADLSWAMLAEAKTHGGLPLVRADASRLPFADGVFDVTLVVTTLAFLPRPRAALAEALRVSRYGLLLGVLNLWSALGIQRQVVRLLRPTLYADAHFYGVGKLVRLLRTVAGPGATVIWRTTLFPRWWPWPRARQRWGSFIAAALIVDRAPTTARTDG